MEATSSPKNTNNKKSQTQNTSAKRPNKASPKSSADADPRENDDVEKLINEIKEWRKKELESRVTLIRSRIEIGKLLLDLQKQVQRGEWGTTLARLGYDKRQAQRMMQIASSPWAEEFRTNGTHWGLRLPTDLQKLASLARISLEQFQECLDGNDLNELSREEVAEYVNRLLGGPEDNAPAMGFTSSDATADQEGCEHESADSNEEPEDNADGAAGQEMQSVRSHANSIPRTMPQETGHKFRVQNYRRIVSDHPRKNDRPAVKAIDRVFDAFEYEVLRIARQYGKQALNKAGALANLDEVTLAMVLLHKIKERLDPERAFAPEETNQPNS